MASWNRIDHPASMPRQPTLLVVDDSPMRLHPDIAKAYAVTNVRDLEELSRLLSAPESPITAPLAALVDVNLSGVDLNVGLSAVQMIRSSPMTSRTVPILFTHTFARNGGIAYGNALGDLHALLCAYACGPGISVLPKEGSWSRLGSILTQLREDWSDSRRDYRALAARHYADVPYIPAITFQDGIRAVDIVEVMFGTPGKLLLWEKVQRMRTSDALRDAINAARPPHHMTLEAGGNGVAGPRHMAAFMNGRLGRLLKAWYANGRTFLSDDSLIHGSLNPVADPPAANPGEILAEFVGQYRALLGLPVIKTFSSWYFSRAS